MMVDTQKHIINNLFVKHFYFSNSLSSSLKFIYLHSSDSNAYMKKTYKDILIPICTIYDKNYTAEIKYKVVTFYIIFIFYFELM